MSSPLLPVPWISQLGLGADANRNDCGAASGLMLLRAYHPVPSMTVDEFYKLAHPGEVNTPLYLGEIAAALSSQEAPVEVRYGLEAPDLYDFLRRRRPVIALIHYGTLVEQTLTQFSDFMGAHFVIVVGMDIERVYIHDPYTTTLEWGQALAVPVDLFETAWTADPMQDGNPLGAAIVPLRGIGEIPVTPPAALFSVQIVCNAQYVRSGPGMNHPVETVAYKGAVLPVYGVSGEWGQVGGGRWLWLDKTGKNLNKQV